MKIACIGNSTLDCTVSMEGFIKEDERNNFYSYDITPGGPACNAASVIAKFGNNVDFYGQLGNDMYGKIVGKQLEKENIDTKYLKYSNTVLTPYSFIIINTKDNTRTINTVRSKQDYEKPKIENFIGNTDYDFILTDGKYPEESIKIIEKNPNAISVIDAGRVNDNVIKVCKKVNYIICSKNFAEGVTGSKITDDEYNNAIIYNKLKSIFPNALGITITVGKKGYICEKDSLVTTFSSHELEIPSIDTNAAGDIFHGAFVHAIANNYDYYDALEFANITASLSTTRHGGRYSCPDLDDVEKELKKKLAKRFVKNFKKKLKK